MAAEKPVAARSCGPAIGMAGPTAAEWLNDVTRRAKFDVKTGTITADVDDWGNLVSAAKIAYGITDDELADLNPMVRRGR
jgi:hypothetical protein